MLKSFHSGMLIITYRLNNKIIFKTLIATQPVDAESKNARTLDSCLRRNDKTAFCEMIAIVFSDA